MNQIVAKQNLAQDIEKIVIEAPQLARKTIAGQFVVLVIDEKGERIPLTVADTDKEKGTITIIFQKVGKTTFRLGQLNKGDVIANLLGPLGKATEIKRLGTVITVGGGVGIAEVYPITRAFKHAGNYVVSIIGARSKSLLILQPEIEQVCDSLLTTTDDGTSGRHGFVSDTLRELLLETKADLVYAVGPVPMMQEIAKITRPYNIKTLVSLNPIMVDATGMCGSCRVCVGSQTKFACVDGPEFDAHLVDFEQLSRRLSLFSEQEQKAKEYSGCKRASP